MHLVGYLYEDYHDARSLEHKAHQFTFVQVSYLVSLSIEKCQYFR
jgi:hypothetical protein